MNGMFLGILSSLVFMIFGIFFAEKFMESQTNVQEIIDGGTIYLRICTIVSIGVFSEITFSRLLQATGRTIYSMIGQLVGACVNIVMDPILIFGLLGLPKMGIAGAAIATVIGQICGAIVDFYFNMSKNKDIHFKFRGFRPNPKTIKEIYEVGIPAMLNTSIISFMTLGMNKILIGFSTSAAAVLWVFI